MDDRMELRDEHSARPGNLSLLYLDMHSYSPKLRGRMNTGP